MMSNSDFLRQGEPGLPPTPIADIADSDASVTKLFAPPDAIPNIPPINNVILNTYLKQPP